MYKLSVLVEKIICKFVDYSKRMIM
jgi:hypothetical protein